MFSTWYCYNYKLHNDKIREVCSECIQWEVISTSIEKPQGRFHLEAVADNIKGDTGFEVLTSVTMDSTFFWNITLCSQVKFH
jgi:hypothetical protein